MDLLDKLVKNEQVLEWANQTARAISSKTLLGENYFRQKFLRQNGSKWFIGEGMKPFAII